MVDTFLTSNFTEFIKLDKPLKLEAELFIL